MVDDGTSYCRIEREFAIKMNVKYSFAVNSGTAALHLSNIALGITAGDEVICPPSPL